MNHRAEELAALLRATMEAVEVSFREIRPPDRERPITDSQHQGGSPWSATDHLAHVVQSEWGFLAIGQRLVADDDDPVRLSRRGNTSEERTTYVNSENQAQVESRRGQSLEDLLEELREVCAQRIQLLRGLSNDQLARLVPGSQRPDLQWAELLGTTRHADAHVKMVQSALAETRA
ncbi:MAG: DinB family protein [Candidatus Dormibacterales bacterium]